MTVDLVDVVVFGLAVVDDVTTLVIVDFDDAVWTVVIAFDVSVCNVVVGVLILLVDIEVIFDTSLVVVGVEVVVAT